MVHQGLPLGYFNVLVEGTVGYGIDKGGQVTKSENLDLHFTFTATILKGMASFMPKFPQL